MALGAVTDARQNGPNWLGAIRGGYGNPLKVLVTNGPVIAAVEAAFRDALGARALLAQQDARFRLDVRVERYDCNQFFPREAHLWMVVTLVDVASGAAAYEHRTHINKAEGGISAGIFSPVEPLRALANAALQEGIDQALDDPGLRAALSAPAVSAAAESAAAPVEVAPQPSSSP